MRKGEYGENKNGKIPDSSGVVTPVHRTIQQ